MPSSSPSINSRDFQPQSDALSTVPAPPDSGENEVSFDELTPTTGVRDVRLARDTDPANDPDVTDEQSCANVAAEVQRMAEGALAPAKIPQVPMDDIEHANIFVDALLEEDQGEVTTNHSTVPAHEYHDEGEEIVLVGPKFDDDEPVSIR